MDFTLHPYQFWTLNFNEEIDHFPIQEKNQ